MDHLKLFKKEIISFNPGNNLHFAKPIAGEAIFQQLVCSVCGKTFNAKEIFAGHAWITLMSHFPCMYCNKALQQCPNT